ncbi:Integrase core domain-containing protein [Rhizobium sp. RU20A]|nr:Integrase core domain-containing protein [Rhizobium sp. RU20A]
MHILLKRDGWPVNPKRIYRLYKEMDLQLRNKVPKRRVKAKLRSDRTAATRSNHVWAMDFVHDQLATGRRIRVLTVVDTFSRFSPVVDARFSYKGEDVVQTLERTCRQIGYPAVIRVDNGSEFISRDLDLWAYHKGVVLDFSRPGKPCQCRFKFPQKCRSKIPQLCRGGRQDGVTIFRRSSAPWRRCEGRQRDEGFGAHMLGHELGVLA